MIRRTKSGLPKHCGWNTDHHGKRRVRFRKTGFSTYLTGTPWSEEFMRQYAKALDGVAAQVDNVGSARTVPGTINALLVSYYRSPEFRGVKASTQRMRRNILERFRNEHGDKPVKRLDRAHIKAILGAKAPTPEAANNLLKVLRLVLAYAVDVEMIPSNPALGIKRYKGKGGEGFHTWTEAEVAQYEAHHPLGSKERLALALMLYTGQRRSDVVKLGRQHLSGNGAVLRVGLRQEKTDEPLMIPIHPVLASVLSASQCSNLTFLVTEFGKPFTAAGFGNWFRDRCDAASLPQCAAHGLRKLAATRLAEAGCSHEQIKAVTGHRSDSALAPYIKKANKTRLARQALDLQLRAEGEQELSNLADPVGQKAG